MDALASSHRAAIVLFCIGLFRTSFLASPPATPAEAGLFRVVQPAGRAGFELHLVPIFPFPIETYLEAQCLLDPQSLFGSAQFLPDPEFVRGFDQLRKELDGLLEGSKNGPSSDPSVIARLTATMQRRAVEVGLVDRLVTALRRDTSNPASCLKVVDGIQEARERERTTLAPLTYEVVGLCGGPSDQIESHLSFHPSKSWSSERAAHVLPRLDTPEVRACLGQFLREDDAVASLVKGIGPDMSGYDYEEAVSAALAIWASRGLEAVLEAFTQGKDLEAEASLARICRRGP